MKKKELYLDERIIGVLAFIGIVAMVVLIHIYLYAILPSQALSAAKEYAAHYEGVTSVYCGASTGEEGPHYLPCTIFRVNEDAIYVECGAGGCRKARSIRLNIE